MLVTTNFALTYFIVSGEIEASRVPAWLLVKDSEGLSVLTAWAAGKFAGDDVGMFVKKCGIMDKVKHTELVIPGYAAAIESVFRTDRALKQSGGDPRILLERVVVEVCGAGGAGRPPLGGR